MCIHLYNPFYNGSGVVLSFDVASNGSPVLNYMITIKVDKQAQERIKIKGKGGRDSSITATKLQAVVDV